jgi:RNA polymerase sigma factor (sigma-70 family)
MSTFDGRNSLAVAMVRRATRDERYKVVTLAAQPGQMLMPPSTVNPPEPPPEPRLVPTEEFDDFVRNVSPMLIRSAKLMLAGSTVDAEGVVQETLVILYRRWAGISRTATTAYAYRTMTRLVWRQLGKSRREHPAGFDPEGFGASLSYVEDRDDLVPWALTTLPPRQRQTLVLRFVDDLSVAETARAMRCSEGTVKSQSKDGLDRLREILQESRYIPDVAKGTRK